MTKRLLFSMMVATTASLSAQFPASWTTGGEGCARTTSNLIYELFPAGMFDLDGTSLTWRDNGTGSYITELGALPILPPTGGEVTRNEDDLVFSVPLGFSFEYPTGATTEILVGANGHIFFEPSIATRCCSGSEALASVFMEARVPSMAACNRDLNTSATLATGNGRIWYEQQSIAGSDVLLVTWEDAGEFGVNPPAAANNFQIQLWNDPAGDRAVFAYGSTTLSASDTLVGWSAGADWPGELPGSQPNLELSDTGSRDLSAGPVDGGVQSEGIQLQALGVPLVGQPFSLRIRNVPSSTQLGLVLGGRGLSFSGIYLPVSLDAIGWQGCPSYLIDAPTFALPVDLAASEPSATLLIPDVPAALGVRVRVQAALLGPPGEYNPAGGLTSNAGDLRIGDIGPTQDPSTLPGLVVHFEGSDTFAAASRPQPFFNVYNHSTRPGEVITSVRIDLATVSTFGVGFDIDQHAGDVGAFDVGNAQSLDPACEPNAYRGSDLSTGLVYAGTELATGCPLALGATTGWTLVTQDLLGNPSCVEFTFQSFDAGKAFVFEADTDLEPKTAGGLASAEVTITTNLATYGPATLVLWDDDRSVLVFE